MKKFTWDKNDNIVTSAPISTTGVPALHPDDRCDRCGAHAFFRVAINVAMQQFLDFCWHHFRQHEIAFRVAGYNWEDQSHRIPGRENGSNL